MAVGNPARMKKPQYGLAMSGELDELGTEDRLLDDDDLLPDKILRISHRAKDGHVAVAAQYHTVDARDNMLVLYVYMRDTDGCTMHRHYIYSPRTIAYNAWRDLAAVESYEVSQVDGVIGVFGWCTTFVNFTALREGDVLTNVQKEKYTYVRLSFGPRKAHRKARATRTQKPRKGNTRIRL